MYTNCFQCTHSIVIPVKKTLVIIRIAKKNIKTLCVLPTKDIHIFRKVSRIKINYFPKRSQLAVFL